MLQLSESAPNQSQTCCARQAFLEIPEGAQVDGNKTELPPFFYLDAEDDGPSTIVTLHAPEFTAYEDVLAEFHKIVYDCGRRSIVVDLEHFGAASSELASLLVSLNRRLLQIEGSLRLRNLSDVLMNTFQRLQLDRLLVIEGAPALPMTQNTRVRMQETLAEGTIAP